MPEVLHSCGAPGGLLLQVPKGDGGGSDAMGNLTHIEYPPDTPEVFDHAIGCIGAAFFGETPLRFHREEYGAYTARVYPDKDIVFWVQCLSSTHVTVSHSRGSIWRTWVRTLAVHALGAHFRAFAGGNSPWIWDDYNETEKWQPCFSPVETYWKFLRWYARGKGYGLLGRLAMYLLGWADKPAKVKGMPDVEMPQRL
jgi:hypothetical protein